MSDRKYAADNATQLSLSTLFNRNEFVGRHIGPNDAQINAMLEELNLASLVELVEKTVPASILLDKPLALPAPKSEQDALALLRNMVAGDKAGRSFIGLGYYDTYTPNVILCNVLENPGWYTAYTPYQPEISQGRLECLLHFQQMVIDLTGMEISNASLLDEATAAAEAMAMAKRVSGNKASNAFFVDENCFPQTIDVVKTRARGLGIELVIAAPEKASGHDIFGALFQYPAQNGAVTDFSELIADLHKRNAIAVVAADIMSLVLLKPPGEMGADVVVGSSQRFGIPMGYGGPHAAYFATRDVFKRSIPGRLIGVSKDSRGHTAYRMALQTREQHIRREKANSNICTSQVLLANMAALYAMYHGASGLITIARRIHRLAAILAQGLQQKGLQAVNGTYFDTLTLPVDEVRLVQIQERAESAAISLRYDSAAMTVGLSLDECTSEQEIALLWQVLLGDASQELEVSAIDRQLCEKAPDIIPSALQRSSSFLTHRHFIQYQSETEMLRYLKKLEDRDISLNRSMIPLGSCTMKLNATAEMLPISWPEFSRVHPFTPVERVPGYQAMLDSLEAMLMAITGFDAVCMQPNSGAQGEYTGLYAIRNYLDARGETERNICLIPSSAHGTNPASAHMVGMKVVIVACDEQGNVDVEDLKAKAGQYRDTLAALMVTYPSTHGVYEESIREICRIVHAHGGQVYLDGANLNALVGLSQLADIGADVSHVNLHKTFCIPHGGGGPGMGPIGVKQHLIEHLPSHSVVGLSKTSAGNSAVSAAPNSAVSAAPWGSASILPISWMYIAMMGGSGLTRATQVAILNANYIACKLSSHYRVLYTGQNDMVAHECIIDLRPFKQACGITEEDVAKRLMDFGYHAPTMSFPVAGTLMIEPTESETQDELDRFIEAMIIIRQEIADVEAGKLDQLLNPLKKAPHTLEDIVAEDWDRPYSREQAAFPADWVRAHKYWPPVNRVDNVYGDKNLFCACPPVEVYL